MPTVQQIWSNELRPREPHSVNPVKNGTRIPGRLAAGRSPRSYSPPDARRGQVLCYMRASIPTLVSYTSVVAAAGGRHLFLASTVVARIVDPGSDLLLSPLVAEHG